MRKFNILKLFGLIFATTLLFVGCSKKEQTPNYKCITPIDNDIPINSLSDTTIAAEFNIDNINCLDQRINMEVFTEYIYDADKIDNMQIGDTLIYEGKHMPVDSIIVKGTLVIVNGGIEQNGAELTANENGTYRATTFDTHSVYKSIGSVTLPMAQNITLIDCGENPNDPNDTINNNICEYLEKLPQWRTEFSALNTKIKIKNGKITEINRRWIP